MYLCENELNQLRAELIPDDDTSCTSSLATTVSINMVEDADDLYLGAEGKVIAIIFHTDIMLIYILITIIYDYM